MTRFSLWAAVSVLIIGGSNVFSQQAERGSRQRQQEEQTPTRGERSSQATAAEEAYGKWWKDWLQDERHEKTEATDEQRIQSGAREFIRRYDQDNDGYVAKNELPRNMREAISQLDANDDGFLSRNEIEKHAQQMRQMASAGTPVRAVFVWVLDADRNRLDLNDLQQAYELLQEMDQNSDGQISRSEMNERRQEVMAKFCNRCFNELDEDGDGELTRQETKDSVFASHFQKFDRNGDDALTKSEIQRGIEQSFDSQSEASRTARGKASDRGSREQQTDSEKKRGGTERNR